MPRPDKWLEFAQFNEADAGDGFDLAQGLDSSGGGGGIGDVDLNDGEGLALGDSLRVRAGWIVRRQEASPERLVYAIQVADGSAGDPPPDLLGGILAPVGRAPRAGAASGEMALTGLSQREIDVIELVAEGLETREIAAKLSYSERTIKNVLQGMMLRLGLRNRPHVVAYAARKGYLRLRRGSGRCFPGSPRRGGRVPRRRRGIGRVAARRGFALPFRGSGVRGSGPRPS